MSETIPEVFRRYSVYRLEQSERDLNRCLDRLTDEQILHRSAPHENSIANLLQHLAGNMRQWILHGIAGQPDVRARDAEFLLPTQTVNEIRRHFAETLAAARQVIAEVPDQRLLEITNPQPGSGWEAMTLLEAISHVVGHVQQHTGQIILLTKQQVGADLDLTIPRKR
jgi:uncharacterized damage-inducible protein DinB